MEIIPHLVCSYEQKGKAEARVQSDMERLSCTLLLDSTPSPVMPSCMWMRAMLFFVSGQQDGDYAPPEDALSARPAV